MVGAARLHAHHAQQGSTAGGHWTYTMHGPDGVDYPNTTKYFEVEKYAKLVYDHGGNDDRPPMFRVTVLFSEVDGKTKMEMTMTLPTPEAAEETRKFIKKAGGNSTWDRLAEYLEKESSGKEQFVINRTFDAPLEVMFEMWTDPKHFSQWLPPTGFEMQFIRSDIRPGGSSFYFMTGPGGVKMYGRAEYLEIEKPDRIVYTQQFCDENEKRRAPSHVAHLAGNDADDRELDGGGPGPNPRDRDLGTARRHDARRARNLHQSQRRHDPRLDRIVRQAGGVPGKELKNAQCAPADSCRSSGSSYGSAARIAIRAPATSARRSSGRSLPGQNTRAGRAGCRRRPCCGCGLRPAARTRAVSGPGNRAESFCDSCRKMAAFFCFKSRGLSGTAISISCGAHSCQAPR